MASSTSRSASTGKASSSTKATKKSPAKTSAKKASAKKASAKRTSAKKAPAEKAPSQQGSQDEGGSSRSGSAPRAEARPAARASQVAAQAASELLELTGKSAEGVTGLERTEEGWTVQVEVCEVRRIPDTTDVLALYEVSTDKQGSLLGYRRVRRYTRGAPGEE